MKRHKIAFASSVLVAVAFSSYLHAADENTAIFISDFEPPGSSMFDFEAVKMSTAPPSHVSFDDVVILAQEERKCDIIYALESIKDFDIREFSVYTVLLANTADTETSVTHKPKSYNHAFVASSVAITEHPPGLEKGVQAEAESIVLSRKGILNFEDTAIAFAGLDVDALGSSWEFL